MAKKERDFEYFNIHVKLWVVNRQLHLFNEEWNGKRVELPPLNSDGEDPLDVYVRKARELCEDITAKVAAAGRGKKPTNYAKGVDSKHIDWQSIQLQSNRIRDLLVIVQEDHASRLSTGNSTPNHDLRDGATSAVKHFDSYMEVWASSHLVGPEAEDGELGLKRLPRYTRRFEVAHEAFHEVHRRQQAPPGPQDTADDASGDRMDPDPASTRAGRVREEHPGTPSDTTASRSSGYDKGDEDTDDEVEIVAEQKGDEIDGYDSSDKDADSEVEIVAEQKGDEINGYDSSDKDTDSEVEIVGEQMGNEIVGEQKGNEIDAYSISGLVGFLTWQTELQES
ncbi:hypothetical protein PV04_09761 [Phialophora macrospora]|uniref:Uncharacterized protein n=1 Tax=Phialophora macrospora TaxID=1851006 RepID=A0A0D2FS42_9EURO|nr:hypothetical protein PV04_09761 [Phialophora macrospora]